MTYEEAIKGLTVDESILTVGFQGNWFREAIKAIKKKVEELEHENELKEWPADDFGSDNL